MNLIPNLERMLTTLDRLRCKSTKKEQEKTTVYINRDNWLKFLKELRRLLEKKMMTNPDSECIIVRREELNQCWPEVQDKEKHQYYFVKPETIATILDAVLGFSVVANSQNGEKLKFYENKKSHYATLKEYQKRHILLVILFMIMATFMCLSTTFMTITMILIVFSSFSIADAIVKDKSKLEELRKIKKAIKMIQPSIGNITNLTDLSAEECNK